MKDIDLINEIYRERIYDSPVALEFKISKFKDKRLANGLILDLFCKSDDYESNKDELSKFLNVEANTDDDFDDHDYYIDFLKSQPKVVFYEFITTRDIGYCDEFKSWIKTLSSNDLQEVIDYCVELEIYEAIPYINDIK